MNNLTRSLLKDVEDAEDPIGIVLDKSLKRSHADDILNANENTQQHPKKDERSRWIVLGTYSYLSALQSLIWMTYSSIPDYSKGYLSINDQTLDLFLDLGPAAFIIFVFVSSYILSTSRKGLALGIKICSLFCFFAALVRCVPVLLSSDSISGDNHGAIVALTYFCQFINGAAAPFVVASPSLVSLIWFPEDQRNLATAIGNVANAAGRAVGFFLGPALVHSANDVPTLLLLEVGLAMLPLLISFWVLPDLPDIAPSRAAEEESLRWDRVERSQQIRDRNRRIRLFGRSDEDEMEEEEEEEENDMHQAQIEKECSRLMAELEAAELEEDEKDGSRSMPLTISINGDILLDEKKDEESKKIAMKKREERKARRSLVLAKIKNLKREVSIDSITNSSLQGGSLLSELRVSIMTPSFVLICLSGGFQMAVYGMWSGVLPSVLSQISPTAGSPTYSDVQCGWFGFSNTIAGIFGGLLFGGITDFSIFRKRLITISIILLIFSAVFFGLIALALPPIQIQSLSSLAISYSSMLSLCIMAGFLRGGSDPLFFELVAESVSSVGVPAGTAGAVLTFFYHVVLVILLAVPPSFLATITLPGMAAACFIGALLMVPARVVYNRRI
jgi:hypothetical protein